MCLNLNALALMALNLKAKINKISYFQNRALYSFSGEKLWQKAKKKMFCIDTE